jgi:amidohydrolase
LKKTIREKAEAISDQLVEIRRDLHEHPEIGLQETRTSAIVAEKMNQLGLDVKTGIGGTGVAGLLTGGSPGRTIAIRADMDALPIKEDTGLAFASKNNGVMHACGHDGHVAMALGAARILSEMRDELEGNIKFIMQPAEENSGGASSLVEEGILEDPKVDAIIALHIGTIESPGKLTIIEGPFGASSAVFMISINGKGGHSSEPHECIDPIHVATHAIMAIQTMIPRTLDARDPVVVSICSIQSGTAFNVIPDSVHLGGTVRTLSDRHHDEMPERLEEVVRGITATFGASYDFTYIQVTPVPANEPEMTRLMRGVAEELWGAENVVLDTDGPYMASEDYSHYLQKILGVMGFLGARNEDGTPYPPHHPKFDFDERCLPRGAELLAATAIKFLNGKL